MTDDLYERYKEALRLGHVAVLRGAPDEAIDAYRNAASIAPSRALPHTSLGGVLLRLGRLEEALVEYAAAVARAPHDEGALLGQAEALTIAGQRVEAAQALEHVSEIQEAAGRLPEAADTLRRALELEEAPERSRRQRGLMREIRLSAGDQAAEQLLARALRIRDEPADAIPAPTGASAASAGVDFKPDRRDAAKPAQSVRTDLGYSRAPSAAQATPAEPVAAEAEGTVAEAEPTGEPAVAEAEPALEAATGSEPIMAEPAVAEAGPESEIAPEVPVPVAAEAEPAPEAAPATSEPATEAEPVPVAVGVMEGSIDITPLAGTVTESEHQPTGDELLAAAEAADLAGDSAELRSLLLGTARAYASEGRFDAALDATHRLLQRAPGDVDAHIVLVELYVARDWNELAAEKLVLLGRLANLNDDAETRERLCAVASRAFPKDERLEALCS